MTQRYETEETFGEMFQHFLMFSSVFLSVHTLRSAPVQLRQNIPVWT